MKKICFTTILLVAAIAGFGQTGKGSWLLGGNIAFSSTTTKGIGSTSDNSTVFGLNPKIGLFPINDFAVILNTNYLAGSGFHDLTIGPAVRYYFPGSESVKFFVGGGVGFGSNNYTHSTNYQFEAGPAIFIRPSVALELNLYYHSGNTVYNKSENTTDNDYTQSQFGIGVGFMIYLGKNK
jgi:hypothetical protein